VTPRAWKILALGVVVIAGIGGFAATSGRLLVVDQDDPKLGPLLAAAVERRNVELCAARIRS
jgi:hypothetical protein